MDGLATPGWHRHPPTARHLATAVSSSEKIPHDRHNADFSAARLEDRARLDEHGRIDFDVSPGDRLADGTDCLVGRAAEGDPLRRWRQSLGAERSRWRRSRRPAARRYWLTVRSMSADDDCVRR
jgi:hypothetical protein